MDKINDTIEGEVTSFNLALQEFCDMEKLYKLLGNWSKSCGMATVIIDNEGNQVSEDFVMTEFCKTVQSCGMGLECCKKTWKTGYRNGAGERRNPCRGAGKCGKAV